jgi:hypothetical protein
MHSNIDELIENVKQTIDYMDDNDFVTVIWFASEGQFATLVKAAKKDESIKLLLDSIKSTLGCTCFSDPLKEVKKVIDETSIICNNFNITLFTDGEPVTSWSEAEEEMKIFAALNEYKDNVIVIQLATVIFIIKNYLQILLMFLNLANIFIPLILTNI